MYGSPYRTIIIDYSRHREACRRLRSAFGTKREPLLDIEPPPESVPRLMGRIADMITEWYAPFLMREIREADFYEDALPAASLLAYSGKPACMERLAELLRSSRPLDILVSVEVLADLVVYAELGRTRRMAAYYLGASGSPLAQLELECAIRATPHPLERITPPAIHALPPVPGLCPLSARCYISC